MQLEKNLGQNCKYKTVLNKYGIKDGSKEFT